MSQPTKEQERAANEFFWGPGTADLEAQLAQLLADREAASHAQIAALTADRDHQAEMVTLGVAAVKMLDAQLVVVRADLQAARDLIAVLQGVAS